MAMREASSSPAEWARLYHHRTGGGGPTMPGHATAPMSDSTVVTTTGTSPTVTGGGSQPGMEGRVARTARRRSRASRRAPTTLLNTDTANFRAMVQQFTGIPSVTYTPGFQVEGAPTVNFNVGFNEQLRQAAAAAPYGHVQHQQQQQQQYQQSPQSYQPSEQYVQPMFTLGNNNNNPSEDFLQGYNNPRARLEVPDGLFFEGISEQMVHRPASTDNRGGSGGYYL